MAIPSNGKAALGVHQQPVPIGVADAGGRGREQVELALAAVEEAVGTGAGAVGVAPVQVALQSKHPASDLVIVSDLAAAQQTRHARLDRAKSIDRPACGAPGCSELCACVEASPVVAALPDRALVDGRLGDHGALGNELVAN